MRVLIYEQGTGGHFLLFVRYLMEGALERGWSPVLAIPSMVTHADEFRVHLSDLTSSCELYVVPEESLGFAQLQDLAQHLQCEQLLVPNGAIFSYLPSTLLNKIRTPTLLLILRHTSGPGLKELIKAAILRLLSKRAMLRIARLVPTAEWRPQPGLVPDPVDVSLRTRSELVEKVSQWRGGRRLFLLTGVISPWKNPVLTVDAFRAANLESAALAIVGPVAPEVLDSLSAAVRKLGGRGLLVDQLLDPGEMNALIHEAHAVVMAYDSYQANSTSAKCAALGTGIVGAGPAAFLRNVRLLGVGAEEACLTVQSLSEALKRADRRAFVHNPNLPSVREFQSAVLDM